MKKLLPRLRAALILTLLLCLPLLAACGRPILEDEVAAPTPAVVFDPVPTPEPVPTPTPSPAPPPEPTPEPTPEPPAEQAALSIEGTAEAQLLLDGDFMSFASLEGGAELVLRADRPVAGLYLIWNEHPLPCQLQTAEGATACGVSGFMHEYAVLPAPAEEIRLIAPAEGIELCDVYAFTPGFLPDWVQLWEPPWETADLLLFPAHADDEFVFFGGIIPAYGAERGLAVQVAYMTSPYIGTERFRCHELLNGLWTAGLRHYPVTTGLRDIVLNSLDEARYYYGEETFARFQVEMIRRFRPLVVVGHDFGGEYGHGAHRLAAATLPGAVEAAADPAQYAESAELYGAWNTPKLYLHLYGDSPTVLDYETPLEAFGGRTAYEIALDAYACHLSQQLWAFTVYSFDSPVDSHVFGLYRSLVGADEAANDLMEHLDPADYR